MKNKIKEELRNRENINSLLVAILCMSGLISFIAGIDNIIPVIVIIVMLVAELINYKESLEKIKNKDLKVKNYIVSICALGLVIALFFITILIKGFEKTVIERAIYFIGFILIPYICCRHEIKVKKVIDFILIISTIIAIPLFNINLGNFNGGMRMSISYYMLPTFIAMLMTFFVDQDKSIKKKLMKSIIFVILLYPYINFLIKHSSRGVILAIIICFILCGIIKKSTKIKVISISTIIIITVIGGVLLLKPILSYTQDLLERFDIRVEVITKSLALIESGNFGNGREKVFDKAIDGIKQHPIIGNGIGDYADKYITYPHNMLLQAWYEGGIIFFLAMTLVFLYSIYIFIFDTNIELERKYLLILFFSISIIRLMLSYEFWREIAFGLYLYIVLDAMQKNLNIRRNKGNGNCNNTNI